MTELYQQNIIKAYAAFNKRDIDQVLSFMHSDVLWPNGWEGGYVKGHEEVRAYWLRQWKELNPLVTPVSFAAGEDGKINVEVHQLVKDIAGNLVFDGKIMHIYEFQNGLISSMEIKNPVLT